MLELVHTTRTIGADLCIDCGPAEPAHLQLRGRPLVKRVLYLPAALPQLTLSVSLPDARIERLTLVPVSAGFARRRMRARLTARQALPEPARPTSGSDTRPPGPRAVPVRVAATPLLARFGRRLAHRQQQQAHLYEIYCEHLNRHLAPRRQAASQPAPLGVTPLAGAAPVVPGSRATDQTLSGNGLPVHLWLHGDTDACVVAARSVSHAPTGATPVPATGIVTGTQLPASVADRRNLLAFLAPGTELQVTALRHCLTRLQAGTRLAYADHERVDSRGRLTGCSLKPDWNPDMLYSINYIGGFFLCDLDWLRGRSGLSVTERLDPRAILALAVSELAAEQVQHFTVPLSRVAGAAEAPADDTDRAGQAAGAPGKAASSEAGAEAGARRPAEISVAYRSADTDSVLSPPWHELVGSALARAGHAVSVGPGLIAGAARVHWNRSGAAPSVDIIIPTRDRAGLLERCVTSVLNTTRYRHFRILIVDNDSVMPATHRLLARLGDDPRISVIRQAGAFNYSQLNNTAVEQSAADIVLLLNNDTEVINADWLEEMASQAMRPEIGCVGAKLYYSNGLIQHAGIVVAIAGVAGHGHRYQPRDADGYAGRLKLVQNVTAVTGACLAVRRDVYRQVGGLDASHLPVSFNDVDFCLRVCAAGYRNLWTPYAELYHHESVSRGSDQSRRAHRLAARETRYMMQRWQLDRFQDPAYHPRLTRIHEDFGIDG